MTARPARAAKLAGDQGDGVDRPAEAGVCAGAGRDFCSVCGPKFCAMRISDDVRKFAEEGMQDKARGLREAAGEIYVQEIANS